jgi:hypothetical protein
MVFDTGRNQTVMVGGNANEYTWEYFAPCDVVAAGHQGGGLPIACTSLPKVHSNFCLSFPSSQGVGFMVLAKAPIRQTPIPVGPPEFCAPGELHVDPLILFSVLGDPASACIPIPGDTSLVGAAFAMQGMALDVGSCLRLTDAVVAVIMP